MSAGSEVCWLRYELVRSTDEALLVRVDGRETWLPKKLVVARDKSWLGVQGWFARQNGLSGRFDKV